VIAAFLRDGFLAGASPRASRLADVFFPASCLADAFFRIDRTAGTIARIEAFCALGSWTEKLSIEVYDDLLTAVARSYLNMQTKP
jgi:hypothetical protein